VVLTSKPLYQPVCSRFRETIISKGSSGYLEWCRYRQWCFWGVWGGYLPRAAKVKKAFISCKTAIRFNLGAVPSPRGLLEAEKPKQSSKPPNGIVKHYTSVSFYQISECRAPLNNCHRNKAFHRASENVAAIERSLSRMRDVSVAFYGRGGFSRCLNVNRTVDVVTVKLWAIFLDLHIGVRAAKSQKQKVRSTRVSTEHLTSTQTNTIIACRNT